MNASVYIEDDYIFAECGDYDIWVGETDFEEFLDEILAPDINSQLMSWGMHLGMMLDFTQSEKNITVVDYILANANPEQLKRYLNYIRAGINKLYERIPQLDQPDTPTKSARSDGALHTGAVAAARTAED